MRNVIVHVSEVDVLPNSGMGRVEYYWKAAIEKAGYEFIHIGPTEVGELKHKGLFPFKAYQYYKKIKKNVVAIIVHEPAAMFFVNKKIPVFIESHGVERRRWEFFLKENGENINFRTRLLFPIWRLLSCDIGLKKAKKLLLINNDDKDYVIKKYKRSINDIFIFKNGVNLVEKAILPNQFTVLFNGSWVERKGIKTLVESAKILSTQMLQIKYLLIGTGIETGKVLNDWPENLKKNVEIVPKFDSELETTFLSKATVVVLPSNFEGQPLSILQAMAAGKCCITTNSCGQKDFIENGKNGFLFEKHDTNQLANLIKQCYFEPKLVNDIGDIARESMQSRTWGQTSDDLVALLKETIES